MKKKNDPFWAQIEYCKIRLSFFGNSLQLYLILELIWIYLACQIVDLVSHQLGSTNK
jgi:hypothetical protein